MSMVVAWGTRLGKASERETVCLGADVLVRKAFENLKRCSPSCVHRPRDRFG
jgi:hypothetical protein